MGIILSLNYKYYIYKYFIIKNILIYNANILNNKNYFSLSPCEIVLKTAWRNHWTKHINCLSMLERIHHLRLIHNWPHSRHLKHLSRHLLNSSKLPAEIVHSHSRKHILGRGLLASFTQLL